MYLIWSSFIMNWSVGKILVHLNIKVISTNDTHFFRFAVYLLASLSYLLASYFMASSSLLQHLTPLAKIGKMEHSCENRNYDAICL